MKVFPNALYAFPAAALATAVYSAVTNYLIYGSVFVVPMLLAAVTFGIGNMFFFAIVHKFRNTLTLESCNGAALLTISVPVAIALYAGTYARYLSADPSVAGVQCLCAINALLVLCGVIGGSTHHLITKSRKTRTA